MANTRKRNPARAWNAKRDPREYRGAVQRSWRDLSLHSRQLGQDRQNAPRLLEELVSASPQRQGLLLANSTSFSNFALSELLLQKGWKFVTSDANTAVSYSFLANRIAESLSREASALAQVLADLRGECWSLAAVAQLRYGDADEAQASIHKAEDLSRQGTGDPVERSRVALVRSQVCLARGDYHQTKVSLTRAIRLAKTGAQPRFEILALCRRALLRRALRQPDLALADLERGIDIAPAADATVQETQRLVAARTQLLALREDPSTLRLLTQKLRRSPGFAKDPVSRLRLACADALAAQRDGRGWMALQLLASTIRGLIGTGNSGEAARCVLQCIELADESNRLHDMSLDELVGTFRQAGDVPAALGELLADELRLARGACSRSPGSSGELRLLRLLAARFSGIVLG